MDGLCELTITKAFNFDAFTAVMVKDDSSTPGALLRTGTDLSAKASSSNGKIRYQSDSMAHLFPGKGHKVSSASDELSSERLREDLEDWEDSDDENCDESVQHSTVRQVARPVRTLG